MRLANRPTRLRRVLSLFLMVFLLGGMSLTLSQCKPYKICIAACEKSADEAVHDEKKLHKKNLKDCDGDKACEALEIARHEDVLAKIEADRKDCVENCRYHSGGDGK